MMRHVSIEDVYDRVFGNTDGKKYKQRLAAAYKRVQQKLPTERHRYINRNGSTEARSGLSANTPFSTAARYYLQPSVSSASKLGGRLAKELMSQLEPANRL
jgi:hypothetical protein